MQPGAKTVTINYAPPVTPLHALDNPAVQQRVGMSLALAHVAAGRTNPAGAFDTSETPSALTRLEVVGSWSESQPPNSPAFGPPLLLLFRLGLEAPGCRLTALDVGGNRMGNDGAEALGRALRINRTLTSLRFDDNGVGVAGMKAIRGALYGNQKVSDMPIPDNDIAAELKRLGNQYLSSIASELEGRSKIKYAYAGMWRSNPPYRPEMKDQGLATLVNSKKSQAGARSTKDQLRKIVSQISASIKRNVLVAKVKKSAQLALAQAKAAAKALALANSVKQKAEAKKRARAQKVWTQRHSLLNKWAKLAKKQEPSSWYDDWAAQWGKNYLTREGFISLQAAVPAVQAAAFEELVLQSDTLFAQEARLESELESLADQQNAAKAEHAYYTKEGQYYEQLGKQGLPPKGQLPMVDPGIMVVPVPGFVQPGQFGSGYSTDWAGRYIYVANDLKRTVNSGQAPPDYNWNPSVTYGQGGVPLGVAVGTAPPIVYPSYCVPLIGTPWDGAPPMTQAVVVGVQNPQSAPSGQPVIYPASVVPVYASGYDKPIVGLPIAQVVGVPIAQPLPPAQQQMYQYQVPPQQMQVHIQHNQEEQKRRKREERNRRYERDDYNSSSSSSMYMYGGMYYGGGYGSYNNDCYNSNDCHDPNCDISYMHGPDAHRFDGDETEQVSSGDDSGTYEADGFGDEPPEDFDASAFEGDDNGADDAAGAADGIGGDELADVDMYGGAGPQDLPDSDYRPPQSAASAVLAGLRRQVRACKDGSIAGITPRGFEFEEDRPAVVGTMSIHGEKMQQRWEELELHAEETLLGCTNALDFVALRCAFPKHALGDTLGKQQNIRYSSALAHALGVRLDIGSRSPAFAPSNLMVTLVTQLSIDRLDALSEQVLAWDGPVSAALYIPYAHSDTRATPILHDIAACYEQLVRADNTNDRGPGGACELRLSLLWAREQKEPAEEAITAKDTAVLEDGKEEAEAAAVRAARAKSQYDHLYPVNALRNLALRAASTELVLLLDVDFVPSTGAHDAIAKDEQLRHEATHCNSAFVLPAFEQHPTEGATFPTIPRAKEELVALGEEVSAFHVGHFAKGHAPTNYRKWYNTEHGCSKGATKASMGAYEVQFAEHYEPYVVMAREAVPLYDERFRGYGMNKISHLYAVASQGTRFKVLPAQFVIAREHAKSNSWKQTFGTSADPVQKVRVALLYRRFKQDIDRAQRQHLHTQYIAQAQAAPPNSVLRMMLQVPVQLSLCTLGAQQEPPLLELAAAANAPLDVELGTVSTAADVAGEILQEMARAKCEVAQLRRAAETEQRPSTDDVKNARKRAIQSLPQHQQQQQHHQQRQQPRRPAALRYRVVALP
jgi:hypothetical protein